MKFEDILKKVADVKISEKDGNTLINTVVVSKCAPAQRPEALLKINNLDLNSIPGWQKLVSLFITAVGTFPRNFLFCLNILWTNIKKIPGVKQVVEAIAKLISKMPFIDTLKKQFKNIWNKYVPFGGMYVRLGDLFNTFILGISIGIVSYAIYRKFRKENQLKELDSNKLIVIGDRMVPFIETLYTPSISYELIEADTKDYEDDEMALRKPRHRRRRRRHRERLPILQRLGRFLKDFFREVGQTVKESFIKAISIIITASILGLMALGVKFIICKLDKDSKIRMAVNHLVKSIFSALKISMDKDICDFLENNNNENNNKKNNND